ncbi:MAG: hypothetical protein M3442_08815 [Chloroflexota bacterium]|nr:hypothetical protein [Chloroflexota bacterium]
MLVAAYAGGVAVVGTWLIAVWGIQFLAFVDRAMAFFGVSVYQVGASERRQQLRDAIRDAELTVPVFPGATRLKERSGDNFVRNAPALDACWAAPAALEDVLAFLRRSLPPPPNGWRVRRDVQGSAQLGAERGQVRLLVHGPADSPGLECPPGTTYILSLTAYNSR